MARNPSRILLHHTQEAILAPTLALRLSQLWIPLRAHFRRLHTHLTFPTLKSRPNLYCTGTQFSQDSVTAVRSHQSHHIDELWFGEKQGGDICRTRFPVIDLGWQFLSFYQHFFSVQSFGPRHSSSNHRSSKIIPHLPMALAETIKTSVQLVESSCVGFRAHAPCSTLYHCWRRVYTVRSKKAVKATESNRRLIQGGHPYSIAANSALGFISTGNLFEWRLKTTWLIHQLMRAGTRSRSGSQEGGQHPPMDACGSENLLVDLRYHPSVRSDLAGSALKPLDLNESWFAQMFHHCYTCFVFFTLLTL